MDDDGSLLVYGVLLPGKWLLLSPRNLLLPSSEEKNIPEYTVSYILRQISYPRVLFPKLLKHAVTAANLVS